jgi:steroid delta-isomerase-like uncharacterized protein
MSEKHETAVRRLIDEAWNKGNLNLIDELLTRDHVNHDPVNPVNGIDGYKNLVKKYRTAFPDLRLEIDEVLSVTDRVVVRWQFTGTHQNTLDGIPATGRHATGPGITISRFQGDRIQETYVTWDALGLMQQLGVVTMPGKTHTAGR